MLRAARSASLALVLGVLAPSPAAASPEDLFGYGSRTGGMGATGVAHAEGWETAWHNPALASTIRANKLTLGYGGAVFALDASGRVPVSPATGFFVGGDLPLPFGGILRDRVGIALGFYTPSDVIVRGRVLYPERPQFPILAERAQSITVRAGLGVDVGWGIEVGVGFAALAELEGTVVVAADASGRVGTRVDDQLVATYAPAVGATYDLPAHLRVGATFRGTLDARFSVVIDGSKLSSIALPVFDIAGVAQYDPAQVALELARVERRSVLALQGTYKRWSDFSGFLEPTVRCTEGGAGACGLVPPVIPWRDTFVVRLGAEQGFELGPGVVLRVRGGGSFESSPLPSRVPGSSAFDTGARASVDVPTRYFDSARLVATTGAGVSFTGPLPPIDLDVYAQAHVLLPRDLTLVSGAAGPGTKVEVSGVIKTFGLTAGVRF